MREKHQIQMQVKRGGREEKRGEGGGIHYWRKKNKAMEHIREGKGSMRKEKLRGLVEEE